VIVALTALALAFVQAERPQGMRWAINDFNCYVVDGKPYLPVGARIEGTPSVIEQTAAAGIQDLIVELPADGTGWSEAIATLQKTQQRYLIAISSAAPGSIGYAVEPEGYRIDGLTTKQELSLAMPGADHALLVMALKRDSSVQSTRRLPIVENRLKALIDPPTDLEHVALLYPHLQGVRVPDSWEGLDIHRDKLLATLKAQNFGPHFRGIVNPLGSVVQFLGLEAQFVPTSAMFRYELESAMRQKYNSLDTAVRAWAIKAPDFATFGDLSRLVPLWSASRGVPNFWDPVSSRIYSCDSKNSSAWQDIRSVVSGSAQRRYLKLVQSIRKVVDVPIIQEWTGWNGPYNGSGQGTSGIGAKLIGGSPQELLDGSCRPASSALRLNNPSWLIASEISFAPDESNPGTLSDFIRESSGFGMRGWFIRPSPKVPIESISMVAKAATLDPLLSEMKPSTVFYPEAAANPALPVSLSLRRWWLPSPVQGSRIDLGDLYGAYRYKDDQGTVIALWSIGEPRRTKLRSSDPKSLQVFVFDGFDPKLRLSKKHLELTVPQTPILVRSGDEIPIPEDALTQLTIQFENFFKIVERRLPSFAEERYYYSDNLASFERNPGASFLSLREQWVRLNRAFSTTLWLEPETWRTTNFSGSLVEPGASGGGVLALRTRLASPMEGYFASHRISPRAEGQYEIWLAGKIPATERDRMLIRVGDQSFSLRADSRSAYGPGYSWTKVGEISLVRIPVDLKILVTSDTGADLAIDAIVLSPGAFEPKGIRQPDAFPIAAPPGESASR